MIRAHDPFAAFLRMHRMLLVQLSIVTVLAWAMTLYAGLQAPWVNDILLFIDPASSKSISTGAYLFTPPLILLIALAIFYFGRETLYRLRLTRNPRLECALAGGLFFMLFIMSVARTAQTLRIGWI